MKDDEEKEPVHGYAPPPGVDAKTWAEVEKHRIDAQKARDEKLIDTVKEVAEEILGYVKSYYSEKTLRITRWLSLIAVLIVISTTILTFYGRISGEAFAFIIGSIIAYVFVILARIHMGASPGAG